MRFRSSTVSPQRFRAQYVLAVRSAVVDTIFLEFDKETYSRLDELLHENALMLGGVTPTFAYKNQLHVPYGHKPSPADNRAIHPDMLQKVIEHFDRIDFDLIVQRNRVDNYISNILIFAQNLTDLKALIPKRFHRPLMEVDEDVFNIGNGASADAIEEFKHKNRVGLVELQRLFLTDLLML